MNKNRIFFFTPVTIFIIIFMIFIVSNTVKSITKSGQNNLKKIIYHGFVQPFFLSSSKLRFKKSIDDNDVFVSVKNWILKIRVDNQLIISPDFTTNWPEIEPNFAEQCQVLKGHVQNAADDSSVLMTICDNINFYIILIFTKHLFAIYPLHNGSHILEETINFNPINDVNSFEMEDDEKKLEKSEKVKRNSNGKQIRASHFNLTGDTFNLSDDIGPTNVKKNSEIDSLKNQSGNGLISREVEATESLSYFSGQMWSKSKIADTIEPVPQPVAQWLELGVAVDYSVIEFHGKRIQQYIFALLNIVSAIYKDPSLGANLTIVIVRIIFYIDKENQMIHQGNARKSLENVNKWNRKILSSSNKIHDVAVWLTRLDIGGPSGYAPVSGACDPSRSCALNRDEGLTSAFIIAHELAHILGLTHDGDDTADNSCSHEASMGSVMAPVVAATFNRFYWSPCSRKEFHHRSKQYKCLNNPPEIKNTAQLKSILQNTFTMDEQCRMEFGDGYEMCKKLNSHSEMCARLWCAHKSDSQVCKTKKGPPLEGTLCGNNKWCINGYCEAVNPNFFALGSALNNSVDTKWSPWSPWSECSITCGVGVRIRTRKCLHMIDTFGNNVCLGNSTEFEICNQQNCPQKTDLRSEQCAQLTNVINDRRLYRKYRTTWLPHEHEDENLKCRLTCRNVETEEIYISNDFLIDGTPCTYDTTNICIQGKCHLMGCDNVINSGRGFDQCGICDGDNSKCISISNKFQRKIRRATTRIVIIPLACYDIFIEVNIIPASREAESTKIIFRDAQRRKHEISSTLQSYNSTVIVEGTKFKIQRNNNQYEITSRGPNLATVTISLKIPKNEATRTNSIILVNFRYITKRENEDSGNKYSWMSGGWSPCTVSCGSGVRYRTIACRNEQTGRIVSRKKCLMVSKPSQEIEKCNVFNCQFKWIVGKWEGCTKTCGASGVQQRQIYCMHSSFPDNYVTNDNEKKVYQGMVPPNLCNQYVMPKQLQECNRKPCEGYWVFTEWSPCTRSCGKGIQSRMARCVPPESENLFTCNGTAPDELRSCKNSQHNSNDGGVCKKFCKRDKSRYCRIPNLKKYCRVPEFYKRCCKACSN